MINLSSTDRIRAIVAATLVGLLCCGAVALVVAKAGADPSDSPQVGQPGRAASAEDLRHLSVLSDDSLRPGNFKLDAGLANSGAAVDPSEARQVRSGERNVWVIGNPKTGTVCLVRKELSGTGGDGCTDIASAASGKLPLVGVDYTSTGFAITGLFPDEVQEVTLSLPDGQPERVPVVHNVAAAESKVAPIGLSWQAPDGTSQQISFSHLTD